jgi:hypothetical protein
MSYNLSSSFASANGGVNTALNVTLTESYNVIYKSATTYKVNVTTIGAGPTPVTFTAWVLKNGTAVAIDDSGQNTTGSEAAGLYELSMGAFSASIAVPSEVSSGVFSPYFHEATKGTATFGTTEMDVVNYSANTLPFSVSGCGETATITAYSFQLGDLPPGSQQLLTFSNAALNMQGPLGSDSIAETIQLVSLTPY